MSFERRFGGFLNQNLIATGLSHKTFLFETRSDASMTVAFEADV